jgi:hypothetical protein
MGPNPPDKLVAPVATESAREIIAAEKRAQDTKTARLKAARLARDAEQKPAEEKPKRKRSTPRKKRS